MRARGAGWLLLCLLWLPGARAATPTATPSPTAAPSATERSGREIYQRFHDGLADPACDDAGSPRWKAHFATAPTRLTDADDQTLALFGYVVDALRAASLPTEYALIPFVESGYRPDARSPGGPAGLWQMIAVTAQDHDVPMRDGYDGRLSPVDSTAAAVRYLKTLHGMFAGDWRLAVMAYNAGEYRILDALHRSGQAAAHADVARLGGVPAISRDYVRKLHALSCLLDQADDRDAWLQALDHPVPVLQAVPVAGAGSLAGWAQRNGQDAALVRRLNPALAAGRFPAAAGIRILAPAGPGGARDADPIMVLASAAEDPDAPFLPRPPRPSGNASVARAATAPAKAEAPTAAPPVGPASPTLPATTLHTVLRGESAWTIARRYGLRVEDLLARNGLLPRSVLRPGTVLKIALASE